MATLLKQDDWYYLQFYNATARPPRKKVPLKTRTKKTATALARKLEDDFAHGRFDPWTDDPLTYDRRPAPAGSPCLKSLGAAYEAFLESKRGCRRTTLDHYRWVLGPFVSFLGADRSLAELTWRDVAAWLDSTDGNAQSRHTYHTRAGIFARYLLKEGAISEDFSKNVPLERPPDKFSGKLITEADLQRIVNVARVSATPYIADVALVTFDLALRLGEVCAMRRSWVDLDGGRLTIRQSADFLTKNGRDVVKPVTPRALGILRRLLSACQSSGDGYVFRNLRGRRLEPKHTSKAFKRIVRAAGLPESYTFHGLRHGAISKLIANGASIEAARRFADHSSIEMTMRYAHLLDEQYADQVLAALSADVG